MENDAFVSKLVDKILASGFEGDELTYIIELLLLLILFEAANLGNSSLHYTKTGI